MSDETRNPLEDVPADIRRELALLAAVRAVAPVTHAAIIGFGVFDFNDDPPTPHAIAERLASAAKLTESKAAAVLSPTAQARLADIAARALDVAEAPSESKLSGLFEASQALATIAGFDDWWRQTVASDQVALTKKQPLLPSLREVEGAGVDCKRLRDIAGDASDPTPHTNHLRLHLRLPPDTDPDVIEELAKSLILAADDVYRDLGGSGLRVVDEVSVRTPALEQRGGWQ